MAEAVGLGKIGGNGLLINAVYGPRLILGGILTSAELPAAAWPKRDEQGCPPGCSVCREACPIGAIDPAGKVNRVSCLLYSMESPILSHLIKSREFGPADIEGVVNTAGIDDHSLYKCTRCVSACPYPG
jgi:epoxyqueuosine reductase QueG